MQAFTAAINIFVKVTLQVTSVLQNITRKILDFHVKHIQNSRWMSFLGFDKTKKFFFYLGFIPYKVEQPLKGMAL